MTSSSTAAIDLPLSTPGRTPVGDPRAPQRRRTPGDRRLGWGLGLLVWAIAATGSWIPSFWGDEAASIQSAQRPLSTLFRMLGHLDAVHGTYYVFLHFWIDAFGASPFSVRTPAAIATGLAAVGLYFVVRDLRSRRLAVVAAVVFAILPRTFAFGDETRAYAFTAAFAAWSLYLLVRLIGRTEVSKRWWLGYGLLMAAGIYTFLYFGLFVVVHALVLAQSRVPRAMVKRWAATIAGAVVLALPVIVYGIAERDQVAFLAGQENMNPRTVFMTTWFGNWWFAGVAWALVAIAVAGLVLDTVRDRRIGLPSSERRRPRPVSLTWLGVAWMLAPLGVLALGNLAVANFTPRYLSYSTPGAALLMAIGLARFARVVARLSLGRAGRAGAAVRVAAGARSRRTLVVTLLGAALIVGMAVPENRDSRGPYAKNNSGWQNISEIVGANASAGDAIVFDESTSASKLVRSAKYLYPAGFTGLRDVTLETPYADTVSWHDDVYTVEQAMSLGRFRGVETVWVVEYAHDDYGLSALEEAGFTVAKTLPAHNATILKLTR